MNQTFNREILEISVDDIVPNRFQPRLTFDTEALNELANSIKEHGIIQPLVVRRLNDKYEIIAGERRYKAATLVGMKKVPCVVMELTDNESAEVAVIENIQRKEMTPLEEAKAFKKILDKGYLTQEELAKRMGKSQSSIANKLRLLNLDEVVQDAVLDGKISERHARSLLKIEDKKEQRNVLGEIINNRLTVRQTDELIKEKYSKGDDIINTNEQNNKEINNNINPNINNNSNNSIFKESSPVPNNSNNQNNNDDPYSYMSMPEVKLPQTNIMNDVNPQLNIMNNLGKPSPVKEEIIEKKPSIEPSSSLDIFKFDSAPQPVRTPKEEIQNVINPSVFSDAPIEQSVNTSINNELQSTNNQNMFSKTDDYYNKFNNGMTIDINEVKNNAQDIIQKEESTVDMSSLLSTNHKPENKFFVDLDVPINMNVNVLDSQPPRVKNSVNEINKKIEELKLQGTNIFKEETDLGNSYQIIIRIDK